MSRFAFYNLVLACLASLTLLGCNAGVVNAPPPFADVVDDPGADPGAGVGTPPPGGVAPGEAEAMFTSGVLPLMSAECGTCHADRTQTGPDFLLGAAPYATVTGWNPALIVPGEPLSSRLLTYGVHTGPAMSAGLLAAARAWVQAETVGPGPGGGPGVGGNLAPVAVFDVLFEDDPFRVSFDATRSVDDDGTIVDYNWSYGDGQTGTGTIATHLYDTANTFAVQLTVVDDMGDSTTATQVIDVGTGLARVVRFTLVQADTGDDIRPLLNGADLDLAALPAQLSVRADTVPAEVGSVSWNIDGVLEANVENNVPYAISGDNGGTYTPYEFTPGTHTIAAIAHTESNANGIPGPSLTITFNVR